MKLNLAIALFFFCGFIGLRRVSCDGSGRFRWICACHPSPEQTPNYSPNCSTSCNCTVDVRGLGGETWNCSCASDGSPQAPSNEGSCFTTCSCTSDSPETPTPAKKHLSNGVVVLLLLCTLMAIITIFASVTCYFYHKDKVSILPATSSSDKDTSWNSEANLIRSQSTSYQGLHVKASFRHSPVIGFLRRFLLVFGSEQGALPGTITLFSFVELEQATDKFSNANLIGLGGSSNVYRGELKGGRVVAIKKLKAPGGPQADDEFLTEIELLSRLNHCHVVPLLGYCLESQGKQSERLLVFEHMSNGSLRDCLNAQGKEPIDWGTRVGIAIGAAKGLEYLHEAAAPRILHRDIKSTNILLDDKYRAKITDLGMAKRLMTDDPASCTNSPARMLGTFGYFAPEYAIVGKASLKSDVFSFGVVILELITGRQPIQRTPKGDESLVIWATARLRDSKLVATELPDPLLKGNFPDEEMQIMAHLARECLQWDPDSRPTMSEVVQILSTIAPDKTKRRRNLPPGIFTGSSSCGIKSSVPEIETTQGWVERLEKSRPASASASASARRHDRASLPLWEHGSRPRQDPQHNTDTILSAERMERLIFLTLNDHSMPVSDDETLDLTEPRFESFVQSHVPSN